MSLLEISAMWAGEAEEEEVKQKDLQVVVEDRRHDTFKWSGDRGVSRSLGGGEDVGLD